MLRLVTLKLNHRTLHAPIPEGLVDALHALAPDYLVLTEYVETRPRHGAEVVGIMYPCSTSGLLSL
jgi:hypothetical protein